MKKNKQVLMGEKKYKKEKARKQKLKGRKIDLSNDQINMGLANIERLENRRVDAINDYLKRNGFILVEYKSKIKKTKKAALASFIKDKEFFILSKLNLSNKVVDDLGKDMQRFSGLYQITDEKTGKKGQIFQITFIEKISEFKIVKMVDEKDLLKASKKKKYGIYNPKGDLVFSAECNTKRECVDKYTGGNRIQWKGLPSAGWKCLLLKK